MTTDGLDPRVRRSRAKVLAAALELVREGGYAAATVDAVVARSGVAKTTVYRHWPHRAALVVDALQTLGPPAPDPPTGAASGRELVDVVVRLLTGLAYGLRAGLWAALLPALVAAAEGDPQLRSEIAALVTARRAPLVRVLAEARDRHLLADVDVELLADRLVAPLYFRRYHGGGVLDAAVVAELVRTTLTPCLRS